MKKIDIELKKSRYFKKLFVAGLIILSSHTEAQKTKGTTNIYSRQNLIAWCIVPFDSKNRGPVERAEMLNKLGITKLAYD